MLISCAVTAKLICTFGFAYADCWFLDVAAQIFRAATVVHRSVKTITGNGLSECAYYIIVLENTISRFVKQTLLKILAFWVIFILSIVLVVFSMFQRKV